MVEIKIIENEERNEYLIEPYQAFLGARYDNLSDEIKVTFPQKEIDNGSSCTMIITNGDEPIDCVTVYNDKVFKLESPATQYKQVFIGFSFQKADGYIKNTNAGLFFFRGAQPPDVSVPTTPIQREKINLLLAEGLAGVRVAEDDPATMEFTNVDGEPIGEFTAPKGEKGRSVFYITQEWSIILDFPVSGMFIDVSKFNGTPNVGDLGIATNGILFEVMDIFGDTSVSCKYLATIKGEKGEKGDKGDAGSIKFIPVATLPTENIDESAIYLVPIEGEDEQNRFTEYVYIDGKWEVIGAITVQVDHSEYVKKTDIASNTKAGVVKGDATKGTVIKDDGTIELYQASLVDIDGKKNLYNPITPFRLDYAVKVGITDNKEEWSSAERQKARALFMAVATTDSANAAQVAEKIRTDKFLTPYYIDKIYKAGAINNTEEWTDEEKTKACETIGAMKLTIPTISGLCLVTINSDGVTSAVKVGQSASSNNVPISNSKGNIKTNTPEDPKDCANKKYVDDLIAELHAEIEALKGE